MLVQQRIDFSREVLRLEDPDERVDGVEALVRLAQGEGAQQ